MLSAKLLKEVQQLSKEDQLSLYEHLQQQLFPSKDKTTSLLIAPLESSLINEAQRNEMTNSIDGYLRRKPIVRAYLFGEFTHWQKDKLVSTDLLVDFEKGVSHFEVLDIKDGLQRLLQQPVELISGRVALMRILPKTLPK
jgi:predicted nucleotidyltransferase